MIRIVKSIIAYIFGYFIFWIGVLSLKIDYGWGYVTFMGWSYRLDIWADTEHVWKKCDD